MPIVLGKAFQDYNQARAPSVDIDPNDLKIPLSYHTPGQETLALVVPCLRQSLQGQPDHFDFHGIVTIDADRLSDWQALGIVRGEHPTGQKAKIQAEQLNRDAASACLSRLRNLASDGVLPALERASLLARYDGLKAGPATPPAPQAKHAFQPT